MNINSRIYLDNAATSWPKPDSVYDAVDHYQREVGAPSGRSGYREAVEANQIVERARRGVARLIGVAEARQIVFTMSGTDSLNMAIFGVLRPGDHVVTTVCDHNSVLRPLRALSDEGIISVDYLPCDGQGFVEPDAVRGAMRPETRLVAVVHGSNVTGAIQPVAEIGAIVREHTALLLVDAAQTLGHVPVDVERLGVDLLAAPAHKGLLGPLGTGVLYIRPTVETELKPLRLGGTGTQSELDVQPEVLPDKYEPGNHNLLGLAGLATATDFLEERGIESIHAHHTELVGQLLAGLSDVPELAIHGPTDTANRTSVVSFTLAGYDPQELAAMLEASGGVQCRAGLHCAPRMHQALGTLEGGGTVRLSPGWATTAVQIEQTVDRIAELAAVVP
jgi:cysteine desulfurase/selenocysteine lyase